MNKMNEYRCCLTGSIVPQERVEILESMGVPYDEMTIVQVSETSRKWQAPSIAIKDYVIELDEVEVDELEEETEIELIGIG